MLEAIKNAHENGRQLIELIDDLQNKIGESRDLGSNQKEWLRTELQKMWKIAFNIAST